MSNKICFKCRGQGHLHVHLKDRRGHSRDGMGNEHTIICDACDCKGYITEEDTKKYYDSWQLK